MKRFKAQKLEWYNNDSNSSYNISIEIRILSDSRVYYLKDNEMRNNPS